MNTRIEKSQSPVNKVDSNFSIKSVDIDKAFNGKMNYYLDGKLIGNLIYEVKSVKTNGNMKEVSTQVTQEPLKGIKGIDGKEGVKSSKIEITMIKNGNTVTGPLFGMEALDIKLPIIIGKKIKLGDTVLNPKKAEMVSTSAGNFKTIQLEVIRNGNKVGTVWLADGFKIIKAKMEAFGRNIEIVLTK